MEKFITFTKEALDFIKKSVDEEKCQGVKIDIISGGCQGMTYELAFVKEVNPSDLVLEEDGVNVYIASKAVIFISGMVVDFKKTTMGGSIIFTNPNAKSKCGCGKSFCVDDTSEICDKECCS